MCLKKKYISLAIRTVTEWHSRPSIQLSNLMAQAHKYGIALLEAAADCK